MLVMGCLLFHVAHAYESAIAIYSDPSASVHVYLNGKLLNKLPGTYVRIRSASGLHKLQVKVWDPEKRMWYMLRKTLIIEKGFEFSYRVVFAPGQKPQLAFQRRYPVYSKYFINRGLYSAYPIT
jgi:hypothetical protein